MHLQSKNTYKYITNKKPLGENISTRLRVPAKLRLGGERFGSPETVQHVRAGDYTNSEKGEVLLRRVGFL